MRNSWRSYVVARPACWPSVSEGSSVELIDCLPIGTFELSHAPEAVLRMLFETFHLKVRYNRITDSLVV